MKNSGDVGMPDMWSVYLASADAGGASIGVWQPGLLFKITAAI